jgi:hypothetical protein
MAPFVAPLDQVLQGVPDAARGDLYIGWAFLGTAPIPQSCLLEPEPLRSRKSIQVSFHHRFIHRRLGVNGRKTRTGRDFSNQYARTNIVVAKALYTGL